VQPSQKLFPVAGQRPIIVVALLAAAASGLGTVPAFAQETSAEPGQTKSEVCAACHGPDGNSIAMPIWPSLAGQHEEYLVRQIEAFRSGERSDPSMQAPVSSLSEQDMQDIAAWFASQSIAPKGADPALVDRGQRIYRGGIPERGIPACTACHGPSGQGNPLAGYRASATSTRPIWPRPCATTAPASGARMPS
jgi:cytochrome c553